jgi:hypothetical protein
MNRRGLQLASLVVAIVGLSACPAAATAQGTTSPLPDSDYSVKAACSAPRPGRAACLALQLVPITTAARERAHPIGMARLALSGATPSKSPANKDFGLRPQDLHSAYELPLPPENVPSTAETGQTVALIDAYNDPTAEADLKTYDKEFGLPECTTANGCFRKVGQTGSAASLPFPKTTLELEQAGESEEAEEAIGWGAEISLDIESAHATCEGCHILLVEANSSAYSDLETAEEAAATLGATEMSNSWGGNELGATVEGDETGPFNDPNIVITASGGDNGFLGWDAAHSQERGFTNYPAASPHVVAVGGTRLTLKASGTLGAGGTWVSESVWNGDGASGGGCSKQFTAPPWQQASADWSSVGCTNKRAVADVSADADPHTGIAVMDSSPACESEYTEGAVKHRIHWCTYGGTSLASPIIAAVFALAGGSDGVAFPAKTLYENERRAPATLHDVTSGSNGACASGYNGEGISLCEATQEAQTSCAGSLSCLAGAGYDGPSGVGTPHGILAFEPNQEGTTGEEEKAAEAPLEKGTSGSTPERGPFVFKLPTTAVPMPAPSSPPSPILTATPSLHISSLALTSSALIALDRRHPRTSAVGFSFTANTEARLRITLSVKTHGHARWHTLSAASTTVQSGRNSRHLQGRHALSSGLYRLRLTLPNGSADTVFFHIG